MSAVRSVEKPIAGAESIAATKRARAKMRQALPLAILVLAVCCGAQDAALSYHLQYRAAGESSVHVRIDFSPPLAGPAVFIVPRNYPGGYALVLYDSFVEQPRALSPKAESLTMSKQPQGPRWLVGEEGQTISRIEYDVNIDRMEHELPEAIDSSKVRPRYLGLLGYSVFGYIDGLEGRAIELHVDSPPEWPVLSTLAPATSPTGSITARAANYYALADSQILMGPDLQVRRRPGKIPLVMAVYAEGDADINLEADLAREALDNVQSYFGTAPFQQYTAQLELLRPLAGHTYGFSQEHLDSGTFTLTVPQAIRRDSSDRERKMTLFNYAHHIAHC
ncbi:MAG: hypothetical protein JO065_05665, partial [Acidobacteria bacterium]|nr:hypothetical protein [Acidobacteriota bacterium]